MINNRDEHSRWELRASDGNPLPEPHPLRFSPSMVGDCVWIVLDEGQRFIALVEQVGPDGTATLRSLQV